MTGDAMRSSYGEKCWGEALCQARVVGNYPLYLHYPFPNKRMTRAPVVVNRAKTRKGCSTGTTDSVLPAIRESPRFSLDFFPVSYMKPNHLHEACCVSENTLTTSDRNAICF